MQAEFEAIKKFIVGKGVDVGCGTNRLSPDVLAIDQQPNKEYAHADIVHNCHDLDIQGNIEFKGKGYDFTDNSLDFIFSSHCLEDFEDIPVVFKNWWRKIKADGLMILLLPDMEACRCSICDSEDKKEERKKHGRSARYWTIEDYKATGKGNPSHKTNVGKGFINGMLQGLSLKYEMVQCDTINHGSSCTIDFVIRKKN